MELYTSMSFLTVSCIVFVILPTITVQTPVNVALHSTGAVCDAHPYYNSEDPANTQCTGAIDGITDTITPSETWSYKGDPTVASLKSVLDKRYLISKVRFMPRSSISQRTFKDGILIFENGIKKQILFEKVQSGSEYVWEEFEIDPAVYSNVVIYNCTTTYYPNDDKSTADNGLVEMEVYGEEPPAGFTTTTTTVTAVSEGTTEGVDSQKITTQKSVATGEANKHSLDYVLVLLILGLRMYVWFP